MLEWLRGFLRQPGLHHTAALARRLAGDAVGSILPVAAIGSVVLLGLVGGGVDMARAYKAERRLQAACDAGALAGRRSVKTEGFDTFAQDQAAKFFKANYDHVEQSSTPVTPTFQAQEGGNTIVGSASAQVSTALMRVFGFTEIPISVSCTATMGVGNSDVMFVLDNTASMEYKPSADSTASKRNCPRSSSDVYVPGDTSNWSRLCNLKEAMKSFYVTVDDAVGVSNARVRYGFVPYANTVNVGRLLYNLDANYLADSATVYTRQPVTGGCSGGTVVTTANTAFDDWCIRAVSFNTNSYKKFETVSNPILASGANGYIDESSTSTWDSCATRNWWGQCQGGNVTTYKTKAKSSAVWPGCIIERQTLAQASFTFATLATGIEPYTKDLDIDLVPTSDVTTKWTPLWPEIAFRNDGHGADPAQWGCPAAAQNFRKMDKEDFLDYVDALEDSSYGTYHDTGMLWGARLSSPTGIFANNVNSTLDLVGGNVRRHLIFMTDGTPQPFDEYNTMYGIEDLEKRIAGNSSDLTARHQSRFKAICEAVKARGIRLWVIAFGTSKTADLTACASPNSIFEAKSATKLNEAFQEIAKQVGELRISQ